MTISEHTKVSAGITTVVSLLVGAIGCGITWGIYSTRLEAVEAESEAIRKDARELEARQVRVNAQFEEIIRRLDRLDNKLDYYESRSQYRGDRKQ